MLAALGLQVSSTFLKYAAVLVVIIGVVTGIFFIYRHFENSRAALVTQAQSAASEKAAAEIDDAMSRLLRQQSEAMRKALEKQSAEDAAADAAWDATLAKINELPLDTALQPQTPPQAAVAAPMKKRTKTDATSKDPAAALRTLDAGLNRMLERAAAD